MISYKASIRPNYDCLDVYLKRLFYEIHPYVSCQITDTNEIQLELDYKTIVHELILTGKINEYKTNRKNSGFRIEFNKNEGVGELMKVISQVIYKMSYEKHFVLYIWKLKKIFLVTGHS